MVKTRMCAPWLLVWSLKFSVRFDRQAALALCLNLFYQAYLRKAVCITAFQLAQFLPDCYFSAVMIRELTLVLWSCVSTVFWCFGRVLWLFFVWINLQCCYFHTAVVIGGWTLVLLWVLWVLPRPLFPAVVCFQSFTFFKYKQVLG